MKKVLLTVISFLIFNVNILAYSEYVIPGGDNIGITINSKGLIVVGFYKVNDTYIAKDTLKIGDVILEVEGNSVNTINEFVDNVKYYVDNKINIKIKRNNKYIDTILNVKEEDGIYKTGLYIKESVTGIGTLTYIDPIFKIFGSLGHEIMLSETNNIVEVKDGKIFNSRVTSIDRSTNGIVGSKNAVIDYNDKLGTITKNTSFGIYGKYDVVLPSKNLMKVATIDEIKLSDAVIYTTVKDNTLKEYKIKILKVDKRANNLKKAILFEIIDDELLENSGGIVQGMSGSPIIQDNKIIGAVTHVIVDDVKKGYGIFIRTMLEEGEK
jgi:stage IV sporulation protein B